MVRVDVLLPYWGDFGLLKAAVESVLAQTAAEWRLLVFDDCYPSDEAARYFKRLGHKQVRYHRHDKNIGVTANFNFALQAAEAEYLVMMGCDDKMLPNYIEVALRNIADADFYQPFVEVIDEHGKNILPIGDKVKRLLRYKQGGVYSGEHLAASLCRGNWLYFPSILWKTESIKRYGFDENYRIVQDVDLELRLIRDGGRLFVDQTSTFQYRRIARSLSSAAKLDGSRYREEAAVYEKFAHEFAKIGWHKAARAAKLHVTARAHKLIS